MKRMEYDPEFAKDQRMVTVPISGLILNKLCRLENEHMTCLNVWEPTVQANAYNNLETAVLNNDVNEVKKILENGTTYINDSDCNGLTILHLSCIHVNEKPCLDVTYFLLNYPEIDVLLKNFCGNTAFHYFLQICPEKLKQEFHFYNTILKQFLKSNKVLLSTKNNNVSFIGVFFSFSFNLCYHVLG